MTSIIVALLLDPVKSWCLPVYTRTRMLPGPLLELQNSESIEENSLTYLKMGWGSLSKKGDGRSNWRKGKIRTGEPLWLLSVHRELDQM